MQRRPRSSLRTGARLGALLGALSLLASPRGAAADEAKRPAQDYGRPAPATDAGDVVAWPVRVILFPLWLANELILRRPLGWIVRSAESGSWINEATEYVSFGARQQLSVSPSAVLDLGMKPSVGLNATWKYLGAEDNALRVHFDTWGVDYTVARVRDTFDLREREHVFFETAFWRRRDTPFSGLGPRSRQDDRTRFGLMTVEAAPGYNLDFGRASSFEATTGFRSLSFFSGTCCDEPALEERVGAGAVVAPGFGDGYAGAFQRARLVLDTRRARPANGTGLHVEAHEETMFPLDAQRGEARRSWIRYGATAGASLDLTGHQRVLTLDVAAELVDKLAPGPIPFTDRVSVGGDVLMPGFLRNRLVDQSALVARLQYSWPIWVYLDGVLHAAAGNVFGHHFEGFDLRASRLSGGLGIRANARRGSAFEALVAFGTDPLDEKFAVSSFRLVVGSHHAF